MGFEENSSTTTKGNNIHCFLNELPKHPFQSLLRLLIRTCFKMLEIATRVFWATQNLMLVLVLGLPISFDGSGVETKNANCGSVSSSGYRILEYSN